MLAFKQLHLDENPLFNERKCGPLGECSLRLILLMSRVVSGVAAAFGFFAVSHSSKRWMTTNIAGTNSTARQVDAIMPLKTVTPIDFRALLRRRPSPARAAERRA